ncbi:histidine kinase [Sphingomonas sp. Leaf33]|uniref:CHASE4 domain-containing protein n=1 Tax=Sphingomonas sp. Leaf33 TaxID=1736215 RepID=UPI0007017770|nr:CHASE4 domain-containing protein [Sphingomonas sp. Leaf33]KQN25823.1 histidine kinase [Sphingomonas sp. Leaf33]
MPGRTLRWLDRIGLKRIPKSLGAQLVLILTGVGLVGSIAITLLLAGVITPSFNRLEAAAVEANVERTQAALGEFAAKVETAVRDYGDWNASYDYMAAPSAEFERESFSPLAMQNLDVSGMAYVAPDGRIVIARWLDPRAGRDRADMRARLIAQIPAMGLPTVLARQSSRSFYMRFGTTLAAVGVAQVRRSDGSGRPRGYVLMARELTPVQLGQLLQLPARIDLTARDGAVSITSTRDRLRIAVPIAGVDGTAVASAHFGIPRDLSVLGRRMLLLAVGGAILLLAVVLVVLRRMIGRLVLKPLNRVERHMGVVRASGTLGPLTDDARADEIGSLVTSFNSMLSQLKDLREQVEVQSFKLGQSESAVAVMHNVRNALGPIATILSHGLAASPPADRALLDRAMTELTDERVPLARRQKLVAFVAAALEADRQDREARREGLEVGRKALHNVLEIIGQQQEQAHEKPPLSLIDLSDVVAQNATIARYSGDASIAFVFPSAPHWAVANRVILSQVIGNLLANAGEAIVAAGADAGQITASIVEVGDRVELHIRDNGEGFAPENEPKFFQRGYSTRPHKSGGLGLHWCANAMLAMGGSLRLESRGKGTGASAILTLPAPAADVLPVDEAA